MRRRSALGLTLLEVLVTLVIVAMAAGLAGQAMNQFARIERLLDDGGEGGQQRMLRREWLRSLIAGVLPEQVNTPLQFSGDGQGFAFHSALQQEASGSVLAPMRLSLHHDPTSRRNELRLQAQPVAPDGPPAVVLLSWEGDAGRIAYQDKEGQWHERWPSAIDAPRRPPVMVRIELGIDAGGVLLAPVAGTEPARPRLADWVN